MCLKLAAVSFQKSLLCITIEQKSNIFALTDPTVSQALKIGDNNVIESKGEF